jgi:hypothetical protein
MIIVNSLIEKCGAFKYSSTKQTTPSLQKLVESSASTPDGLKADDHIFKMGGISKYLKREKPILCIYSRRSLVMAIVAINGGYNLHNHPPISDHLAIDR